MRLKQELAEPQNAARRMLENTNLRELRGV